MADEILWGMHAGKTGDADYLFLKHNLIAIGWNRIGNLRDIEPNRDAFKQEYAAKYPDRTPGSIPASAGQLFRFLHEMKPGDYVAYPSKRSRTIHLGQVAGDYRYDPTAESGYPHQRPIKWEKELPRTNFSQGALYEIGSALSLFQIKNYADEVFAAFRGQARPPLVDSDETVAEVAEDIEETTRDFILKTLAQELKGHPFAQFVAHLLNAIGYRTRVSSEGPDGGVDIVAHKDELGFEPPIIKVQVKSTEQSIGDPVVSALYGKVGTDEHGLLVTLGSFTNQAVQFAKSKSNLRLIDGDELVELILAHYEKFDSKYKGILPLKRVYVPEPHDTSGE